MADSDKRFVIALRPGHMPPPDWQDKVAAFPELTLLGGGPRRVQVTGSRAAVAALLRTLGPGFRAEELLIREG